MKILKTLLIVALIFGTGYLSAESYKYNNNQLILNAMQSYTNDAGTSINAIAINQDSITNWNLVSTTPDVDLNSLFTTTNIITSIVESNYFEKAVFADGTWTNAGYYGNLTNSQTVIMLNTILW